MLRLLRTYRPIGLSDCRSGLEFDSAWELKVKNGSGLKVYKLRLAGATAQLVS